jgi:PGF-CTERM protein
VVVDEVNMSAGGYVAIHLVENGTFGAVIGHSSYLQGNTVHEDVAIVLDEPISENQDLIAMPHRDTDGDQVYEFGEAEGLDAPYTQNGTPVTDTAAITGLGGGAEPTPDETPTPTEQEPTPTPTEQEPTPTETEPEPTETETATEEATDTPGQDGPGFGIVVSVLALLAAALLAARRNE